MLLKMTAGQNPPNIAYNYLNSFDSPSAPHFNGMPEFFNQSMFNPMDYYSQQMGQNIVNQTGPSSPGDIKPFRDEISSSPEANFVTNTSSPFEPYNNIVSTASALNFGAGGAMGTAMNPMGRMIQSGLQSGFFPTNDSPTTSFASFPSYPNSSYYMNPMLAQSRLNPMDLNTSFCSDSRLNLKQREDKNHKTGAGTNNTRVRTADKYRTVYSEQIRHVLESEFKTSEYLNADRKQLLATQLDMTERQIKIWFQNRRAKDRKRGKSKMSPLSGGMY
ncbi:unnamed protein product [Bursaphelenchus okinawaensis]|uniref:Homeobox domain-containing protein n=1 Tax=Bursaphelenchus okinawaensis TaxID=465554 RepID=A0A811KMV7_9BILA|nr:unnamed protein product [Bursaphelenchus okinawaensis]CAG9106891.1 unnamed protein product [Bursaphelenchus okinawaensis]